MSDTNAYQLKRAIANVAASQTDSVIVAAVTGRKIRVIAGWTIAGATATTVVFNTKPGGAGTAITPVIAQGVNSGLVLPNNHDGWFETNKGEGLTVTTGAGSSTGLIVLYNEI